MARRVAWTNNSSGHLGTYVYRAPTLDPQALPAPVATVDPVAQGETAEWVDNATLDPGDYDYAVQDYDGSGVSDLSAVFVHTVPADLATAQVGDEAEGGIYAGINNIDGVDYYIIAGKAESEVYGLQWKTSDTETADTRSTSDGLANTQAMEAAGLADHPAAEHCVNYAGGGHSDWHMPASSQILLMYTNLAAHHEFATNVASGNYTWSSSEYSVTDVWNRRLDSGYRSTVSKTTTTRRVRPVRRVAV